MIPVNFLYSTTHGADYATGDIRPKQQAVTAWNCIQFDTEYTRYGSTFVSSLRPLQGYTRPLM